MIVAFQDRETSILLQIYQVEKRSTFSYWKLQKILRGGNQHLQFFFSADILIAVEYLQSQNIIHIDFKTENLVFGSEGYLRLTDLNIAFWIPYNLADTSGTSGYMAPEYFLNKIMKLLMIGKKTISKQEIKDNVLLKQVQIKTTEIPVSWSLKSCYLANKVQSFNIILMKIISYSEVTLYKVQIVQNFPELNSMDKFIMLMNLRQQNHKNSDQLFLLVIIITLIQYSFYK